MFSGNTLCNRIVGHALLLLLSTAAASAELSSSVDRNSISINETLTLTLRYDESTSSDSLDLEILRQDFDVLSVQPQTSNNVSIVNGNYSQQTLTTWTITLAPKREGTLVIPSFNIDGNVSNAIAIKVSQSSGTASQDTPMLVMLETETSQAYVGQQILITVALMAQENISNLSGGRLSLPNAYLELLDQQSFRRVENGIAWQVVEWEYALIPEQSGMIEIPPQLFSGITGATSNFGFPDPFNQRGRRISARSNAQQIEVLPPPDSNGLPWFPASNVQVNSSWSGDTSQIHVGEPLTRTVEIIATGQRASAIPPQPQTDSAAYKIYADQPQLRDQASSSGIIGIRRESTAIVPSEAGELQLPEQRISWWNTNTETWEETVLPAETLQVLPAQQGSRFVPPEASTSPSASQSEEGDTAGSSMDGGTDGATWYWPLSTLILLFVAVLQTWLLLGKRKAVPREKAAKPDQNEAQYWKMVQRAIRLQNAAKLRQAIINWARVNFSDSGVTTLDSLAKRSSDPQLHELLNKLDTALYAGGQAPDFGELGKALDQLRQQSVRPSRPQSGLKPLYPN